MTNHAVTRANECELKLVYETHEDECEMFYK